MSDYHRNDTVRNLLDTPRIKAYILETERYVKNAPWLMSLDAAINLAIFQGEALHIMALEDLKRRDKNVD